MNTWTIMMELKKYKSILETVVMLKYLGKNLCYTTDIAISKSVLIFYVTTFTTIYL